MNSFFKYCFFIFTLFILGCVQEPVLKEKLSIFSTPKAEKYLQIQTEGSESFLDAVATTSNIIIASNSKNDILVSSISPTGAVGSTDLYGGSDVESFRKIIPSESRSDYLLLSVSKSLFFSPLKFFGASWPVYRPLLLLIDDSLKLTKAFQLKPFGLELIGGAAKYGKYWITGTDENGKLVFGAMDKNGKQLFLNSYFDGYGRYVFPVGSEFMIIGGQDLTVMSVSSSGQSNWAKKYPTPEPTSLRASSFTKDSIWVVTESEDSKQIFLLKIGSDGNVILSKKYTLKYPFSVFHIESDGENLMLSGASGSSQEAIGLRVWVKPNGDVLGGTLFNKFKVQTLDRSFFVDDNYIGVGLVDEKAEGKTDIFITSSKKQDPVVVPDMLLNTETIVISPQILEARAIPIQVEAHEIPVESVHKKTLK